MIFKRLSDFKGADAWNAMADMMEPLSEIFKDKEISERENNTVAKNDGESGDESDNKKALAEVICRNHSDSATKILAILAEEDYETFKSKITLPLLFLGVITIISDPDLISLFTLQGLTTDGTSSGSATENTEAKEE
jgi:hypothetical protein